MAKTSKKRNKGYVVKMKRAPMKQVELEVKEVTEEIDDEKTIFQFKFTTGARFNVTVRTDSDDYKNYWKKLKKGDKVTAYVRAHNIISIY